MEARDALRRQVEALDCGPANTYRAPGIKQQFRDQAAGLREMLANIEEQLAEMGVADGKTI